MGIEFFADPVSLARHVPKGFEINPEGQAVFIFAEWSATSDHDPRVERHPEVSRYCEAMVGVAGRYDGQSFARVPYIWVDSEIALLRGLHQGIPKSMGQIAMSRAVSVGQGGPRRAPGHRFAGRLSTYGRLVAEGAVTLEAEGPAEIPWFWRNPNLGTRVFPAAASGGQSICEAHVASGPAEAETGPVFTGPAELRFESSPFEELADLGPIRVGTGYLHEFAFSYHGARVWPAPRAAL